MDGGGGLSRVLPIVGWCINFLRTSKSSWVRSRVSCSARAIRICKFRYCCCRCSRSSVRLKKMAILGSRVSKFRLL